MKKSSNLDISPLALRSLRAKYELVFWRMPGEMALAFFAKMMTAELPHQIKVAVWDAVPYSHIWWGVDEVLRGR